MTMKKSIAMELIRSLRQLRHIPWRGRRPEEACTASETQALLVIGRGIHDPARGLKASEIAQHLHIALPTATQLLNLLEAKGLVERKSDPEDRRVVRVTLTAAGRRELEAAEEMMAQRLEGLIGHLGEERARLLIELLDDVFRYYHRNP